MQEHLKKTVDHVNHLIRTLKDGEKGYETAAEDVERVDLQALFLDFADQRAGFAVELQRLVVTMGGEPAHQGTFAGALHRGWISLKASWATRDDVAILEECERGEKRAVRVYQSILSKDRLGHAHSQIAAQAELVRSAQERIHDLRNALREEVHEEVSAGGIGH